MDWIESEYIASDNQVFQKKLFYVKKNKGKLRVFEKLDCNLQYILALLFYPQDKLIPTF
jgi:hypothetical protein